METAEKVDAIMFEGELCCRDSVTCEPIPDFESGKVLIIHGDGYRSVFDVFMFGDVQIWGLDYSYQEENFRSSR